MGKFVWRNGDNLKEVILSGADVDIEALDDTHWNVSLKADGYSLSFLLVVQDGVIRTQNVVEVGE